MSFVDPVYVYFGILLLEISDGRALDADRVVLCLPPQLAASQIRFSPELPEDVCNILPTVQTWMAGAVKFTLEYAEPFWRNRGYSGMLYSHAGIVAEMYDHTNMEGDKFGFTGFLNGGAASYPQEVRKEFVLRQLTELLGEQASEPVSYFDKVWTDEYVLAGNPVIQRPHQNNGHPLLREAYMNGKLFFCGTETATEFSGYMEGAVIAAKGIVGEIIADVGRSLFSFSSLVSRMAKKYTLSLVSTYPIHQPMSCPFFLVQPVQILVKTTTHMEKL